MNLSLFTISLLTAVSFYYSVLFQLSAPYAYFLTASPHPSFLNMSFMPLPSPLFISILVDMHIQTSYTTTEYRFRIFTKSDLNGNYVNINHQTLYFSFCLLKSLLICVTPPTPLSLSRHPLRLYRWGSSIFQGCLCCCVWGWVEPCWPWQVNTPSITWSYLASGAQTHYSTGCTPARWVNTHGAMGTNIHTQSL